MELLNLLFSFIEVVAMITIIATPKPARKQGGAPAPKPAPKPTPTEEELKMSLPAGIRDLSVAEVKARQTFVDRGRGGGRTISGGATTTEQQLKQSLPIDLRDRPVEEVRKQLTIARQVDTRVPTLGERHREALEDIQKKDITESLTTRGKEVESKFQDLGSFEKEQFTFFQGQVSRGELSVEEAQAKFESSILGRRTEVTGEILKGGGVSGMSTPTGPQFFITPTEAELKSSREKAIGEVGTFTKFSKDLPAREFFPSALSSIGFSTLKLGTEVAGAGAFVKEFGVGGPPSLSRSAGAFKEAKKEAGVVLKTEGRSGDIFGTVVTSTVLFGPSVARLGIGAVKGGKAFVSTVREKGFRTAITPRAGLGTDIALGLSLVQPVRITLPGTTTRTISAIKEVRRGNIIFRDISGGYKGSDVTFSTEQILFKGEKATSGISATETTIPKFKSGLDEIFGGTRKQFSIGLQTSPEKEFALQKFLGRTEGLDIFKSSDALKVRQTKEFQFPVGEVIRGRKGELTFKKGVQSKKLEDAFSSSLSTSQKIKRGEGVEDFIGVGGKAISDFPVAKAKDIFYGRRVIPQSEETGIKVFDIFPREETGIKVMKPSKVKKASLEKTFTSLDQEVKELKLPGRTQNQVASLKSETITEGFVALPKPKVKLKLKSRGEVSKLTGSKLSPGLGGLSQIREKESFGAAIGFGQSSSFTQAQKLKQGLAQRQKLIARGFLEPGETVVGTPPPKIGGGFGRPFIFPPFKLLGLKRSKRAKVKGKGIKPPIRPSFTGIITGGLGLPKSTVVEGIDIGVLPGRLRGLS